MFNTKYVNGIKLKTNPRKLYSTRQKALLWIACGIFAVYAFTLLYPFVYLLLGSFKGQWEFRQNPLGLPKSFSNWANYVTVFEEFQMGTMFYNSVTLTLGNTIVSMTLSCMAAYVLAKYKFAGNKFVYTMVIVASMIPTVASLPATYKLMSGTGLIDTYIGMLLLQGGAFGGAFLYLHAFFKGISWSFAESAMLDGATDLQIFFLIMVPLARKGIMTFTVIRFLGFWNDYWLPSLFYENHPTVAVGLSILSAEATGSGDHPTLFAAMVVSIVPVLIFFAIFQKTLMGNTIGGGIKE